MNSWLLDKCIAYAKAHRHPEIVDKTVWEVFEEERPKLVPIRGHFDGFHAVSGSVSKTCLVRFDNNKYSVKASSVGRPVEVQAYADRIVIRQDGTIAWRPKHVGRQGRIADYLTRKDFAVLDELGYLPFAQAGGNCSSIS